MAQYFKGDDFELSMEASALPTLETIEDSLDEFYADAYECQAFGDLIYDTGRSPLANAIAQNIYRTTFNEVFENFRVAGSFESYIAVFEKIFGESVDITFTVPAPGKLEIDIIAEGIIESNFGARQIEDDNYVLYDIVDYDGDNLIFQTIQGFQSQYELEQMLFEMVPDGIWTQITLALGE